MTTHSRPFTEGHCTLAGATGTATRDGRPLIGGTSDDPFTIRTRLLVVDPPDGARFVATQIVSGDGANAADFDRMHTRGVNDRGFAYTWSSAAPHPGVEPLSTQAFGVPYSQFGRLLLSQAGSVEEAVGLFERYPRAIHGNFLLADASGVAALVEVSTRSLNVETHVANGVLGRTNHYVSPTMAAIAPAKDAEGSSAVRLARITELMEAGAGQIDVPYMARCFSDHDTLAETGWSICAHGLQRDDDGAERGGTVSSELLDPTRRAPLLLRLALRRRPGGPRRAAPAGPVLGLLPPLPPRRPGARRVRHRRRQAHPPRRAVPGRQPRALGEGAGVRAACA